MINTIWDQLLSKLKPCEIEEAQYLLGGSRIEQIEDISREITNLLTLFDEIPSQFSDLSFHKNKVEFYLNKLASKAKELGLEAKDLIGLKTPRDKFIFEFLAEGGSTRPSTTDSIARTPERAAEFEGLHKFKDEMIGFIEDHADELKNALDSEIEYLKVKAEAVQSELIGMTSTPTVKEVTEFARKLEDAVMNDVHPELFRMSGKNFFEAQPPEPAEELDWDFSTAPSVPSTTACKPKLREVRRHSRPNTASMREDFKEPSELTLNGKVSRRLRNLVNDHRGIPM